MRHWLLIAFSSLLLPATGTAQEVPPTSSQGYVFLAPVKAYPGGGKALHLGGGGEGRVYKRLTVGGDLGYLFVPGAGFGTGLGLLSASGSYHFPSFRGLTPFVTAGYGLGFRSGVANFFHFGGGVNHWFTQRVGMRFEVRDYVAPNFCGCGTAQIVQFRFGLAFR